uniref:Uncharacterized protein n=1 Tax=Lepeophtheirus salmonis TaxID=72036 RepID=A0A0K2U564_LEPSM
MKFEDKLLHSSVITAFRISKFG